MPNPQLHIRVSLEGIELFREARIQAMRERKTLGDWLTEHLRSILHNTDPLVQAHEKSKVLTGKS